MGMAGVALFLLAALAMPCSVLVGLVLLAIPGRSRQLAPYALLVYPSAYFSGFIGLIVGAAIQGLVLTSYLYDRPESFWTNTLELITALVAFGALAIGAFLGTLAGMAMANRLWWRFFASQSQHIQFPKPRGWFAWTPFVRRSWQYLLGIWRPPNRGREAS
jgi:hypothetical protein